MICKSDLQFEHQILLAILYSHFMPEQRLPCYLQFSSVQFNSVTQSCSTLCDPMDCSMPNFPVHHQLPELAQTHIHRVGDAIQPSHPLLSPSPPAFQSFPAPGSLPVSQFFSSGGQSIGVSASTSVLPMNIQD